MFAIVSVFFILLSIAVFCLESHIAFRVPRNASDPLDINWTTWEKNTKSQPVKALLILDYVSTAYFTLEFIVRLTACPSKKKFFRGILNWVDIFAVVPFYIEQAVVLARPEVQFTLYLQGFKALRMVRIFRIFKLTRHFSGLKILWHSIKASAKELLLLILFLLITVLIFACLVYYAESVEEDDKNNFKNIPLGFWWALVTMTTLGYGDMYPKTGLGYVVGALCAVAGVLVLALPVPVIVNNFALYYSHAQAKMKLPKKTQRVLAAAHDDLKAPVLGTMEEEEEEEERDDGEEDADCDDQGGGSGKPQPPPPAAAAGTKVSATDSNMSERDQKARDGNGHSDSGNRPRMSIADRKFCHGHISNRWEGDIFTLN